MLHILPPTLRGILASTLLGANIAFWAALLFLLTLIKLLLPVQRIRLALGRALAWIGEGWISCNKAWMDMVQRTRWHVSGGERLRKDASYLITSNHQSWVDILVLQYQLNRRIPLMRFFLKKELLFVPVMGLAWWALDFPFMKRYSKAYLAKHPEKRGKDLETTRKACAKFRQIPVAITNFLEGTRFTQAGHDAQQSPFRHLLKPRAGGIAFVIDAMGEQLKTLVNVTIHYPDGRPSFWDLLCGRMKQVVVRLEEIQIPRQFLGRNYEQDAQYRAEFQRWVNQLWEGKDALLAQLHQQFPASRKA
ncbi:acyltransferase [Stenotrophomonas ginsengisoli]|uniref:Acyltransferase n=1 Tax=Stenotrophomonas ginsengisoli TaxID=336566 RepID=A0A0R0DE16_9GAMM|nr:acyltransferase [Stenotrophomonas ginsengisoli]KRG76538.1 acyltransferase [Stenotrophomonas ginsengisoli]